MEIRKVAVLGAGVMGSGIAAQVSNAGIPVTLLDIVPEGASDRNAIARGAIARLLETEPAAFMDKRTARLISVGNLDDDLDRLADADWIIEVVIERPEVKRDLFRRIDVVRKPGAIVSSNTSTIPLAVLTDGMPETMRRDFMITHFFNPPRYMRLLELVAGPDTRREALETVRAFTDRALGKGVVECKDTPGFIGNRIGIYWMQCALTEAMRLGLSVEEADAVGGRPMGIPKTGVFGLLDLVGLDLMPHVLASLDATLPADDAARDYFEIPALVARMIAAGYTGRKGKGGFYRINREGGRKVKESIDLTSGAYHPVSKAHLESLAAARHGGLKALVEHPDRGGVYARRVLTRTLAYAASLVGTIADDIVAIDTAMRLGYNWRYGPFELIDRLGVPWLVAALEGDEVTVPDYLRRADGWSCYQVEAGRRQFLATDARYRPVERADGVLLLEDVKLASRPLATNASASLWDLGDGVACLEYHTKMNSADPGILDLLCEAIEVVPRAHRALVIYNEGENFSVGANLGLVLFAANIAAWGEIEDSVRKGQETYKALKYAPFPVVGAPSGMALGGGCEVLLHCDAIEAHAESYIGLVEVGVGLIPAWGGCTEMLARWAANPRLPRGPMPAVSKVFETVSVATVAKSAAEAKALGFLRPADGITMNRERLLAAAKARALDLVTGYAPPEPPEFRLPGRSGLSALRLAMDAFRQQGKATAHDLVVADALATVLSGGASDVTEVLGEDDLLALERAAFMRLVREPATLARIEQMLETGRPLRN